MLEKIFIRERVAQLRVKAAERYQIAEDECHVGHLVLEAMLEMPDSIHQIDGATGQSETNLSVANRTRCLANAMARSGLQPEDHVLLMGPNHLDLCIPYYASYYNGYAICAVDPMIMLDDLTSLFNYISPKIVFCPKAKEEEVRKALKRNKHQNTQIVLFDDEDNNIESFIRLHIGTKVNFRPAVFDQSKFIGWLMLTSGTTGCPKVAIIPYDTILNAMSAWWTDFTEQWHITMTMSSIQWISALIFYTSTPLMRNVRLQASVPMTPQVLNTLINKYKPNVTAWTPYLLSQFLQTAGNSVDLSCFKYIAIAGSAIEKALYDQFTEKCPAFLYLVYGMTELLVPVFDFNKDTPFGSVGKAYSFFQYRLVGDNGEDMKKPNESGELWIKGDAFCKGYLNNPEETEKILTPDGWIKTGDVFYKDVDDYYHFVERKRLLIKYTGFLIPPLQIEEVVKKHPKVSECCIVGLEDKLTTETPVAAIVRKPGSNVQAQEIFDFVKRELPPIKQIHGGLFFVDSLPVTSSGKVHRAKVKQLAICADKIYPKKN